MALPRSCEPVSRRSPPPHKNTALNSSRRQARLGKSYCRQQQPYFQSCPPYRRFRSLAVPVQAVLRDPRPTSSRTTGALLVVLALTIGGGLRFGAWVLPVTAQHHPQRVRVRREALSAAVVSEHARAVNPGITATTATAKIALDPSPLPLVAKADGAPSCDSALAVVAINSAQQATRLQRRLHLRTTDTVAWEADRTVVLMETASTAPKHASRTLRVAGHLNLCL